jgi:predicted RNase H-like HicB family nuclease
MNPEEILKKPYARTFLVDKDTGGVTALILEFPGCIAEGNDYQEAWASLNRVAESWLIASHAQGLAIPEPFETWEDPEDRRAVMRLIPLWQAVERWRDKLKIHGMEELRGSDPVALLDLAKALLKIVGYVKHGENEE